MTVESLNAIILMQVDFKMVLETKCTVKLVLGLTISFMTARVYIFSSALSTRSRNVGSTTRTIRTRVAEREGCIN